MASAYLNDDSVSWTPNEVNKLLEQWEKNKKEVGEADNETVLVEIAQQIGADKTARHVRARIKQMRERYLEESHKAVSKWRFFNKMSGFITLSTNDIPMSGRSRGTKRRAPLGTENSGLNTLVKATNRFSDVMLEKGIDRLVEAVSKVGVPKPMTELPPIYPFDSEVPANVAINERWREWNQGLSYQLTDDGIRALIRSGFKDIDQVELLKTKTANISLLHLNYYDKLALQQAMATDYKTEKFELVTNMEGAVIGIHGSVDASDAILLSDDGLKMLEWNRTLTYPLSLRGLAKVLKAGFATAEELAALLNDEFIDCLDLNLRDKIILRKYALNPTKGLSGEESKEAGRSETVTSD